MKLKVSYIWNSKKSEIVQCALRIESLSYSNHNWNALSSWSWSTIANLFFFQAAVPTMWSNPF